jgi:hypothetical protein
MHTMRRTQASLISRRTKNLRAAQMLPATPNWKARFDASASKLATRSRWLNKPRSERLVAGQSIGRWRAIYSHSTALSGGHSNVGFHASLSPYGLAQVSVGPVDIPNLDDDARDRLTLRQIAATEIQYSLNTPLNIRSQGIGWSEFSIFAST